jgi:hypothetical protein
MLLARKNHFAKKPDLADLTSLRCHHRAQHPAERHSYLEQTSAPAPEGDEAVQTFVAEKYLLDELDRKLRDEFEEHMFDCQECALDLLAGATFLALLRCRRGQGTI